MLFRRSSRREALRRALHVVVGATIIGPLVAGPLVVAGMFLVVPFHGTITWTSLPFLPLVALLGALAGLAKGWPVAFVAGVVAAIADFFLPPFIRRQWIGALVGSIVTAVEVGVIQPSPAAWQPWLVDLGLFSLVGAVSGFVCGSLMERSIARSTPIPDPEPRAER